MTKLSFIVFTILLSLSISYGNTTSYFYDENDEYSIEKIQDIDFINFENSINKGPKNGVYWVKASTNEFDNIIEVSSAHIFDIRCYINEQEIPITNLSNYPYYEVGENQTVFLKIRCFKEAFIPINIHEKKAFEVFVKTRIFRNGAYFGFTCMVITLNLFLLFNFKEKIFATYIIFLASLMISFAYRDGLVWLFFENIWLKKYLESICHIFTVGGGILFSYIFLQQQKHLPHIKYVYISLFIFFVCANIAYIYTSIFNFFILADTLAIFLLGVCWFSSLILFKKHIFAKIFVVAFFPILVLGLDFFTSPLYGAPHIGLSSRFVKMGGVVEMLILTFATIYRMKILRGEYREMKKTLFGYTSQVKFLNEELQQLRDGKENKITQANLSTREIEVLTLISQGKSNKEMSAELNISINTIKYHTKKLYEKLNIRSREEARLKATMIVPV